MFLILFYSVLLLAGIVSSQLLNLLPERELIETATRICLAYIMIEVGLEFVIDKTRLKSYGWDFLFAFLAASLPWILCAVYFMVMLQEKWQTAFLVGIFAAPTSAGVLFAMLSAAGLGTTWLFRKAQVLAVFDDFDAILMLITLQIVLIGFRFELLVVIFIMFALLGLAYRFMHLLPLPSERYWLLFYGAALTGIISVIRHLTHIDPGILLPAFSFGAVLCNPHLRARTDSRAYDRRHQEPRKEGMVLLDRTAKGMFMFLVGCSLPKIDFHAVRIETLLIHVLALTVLSNLGKMFLFFCYRGEASWRKRLALSVAMFPRGEVGAGVLLIAMGYGLGGLAVSLSVLSLALNLVLTGVFVMVVIKLLKVDGNHSRT